MADEDLVTRALAGDQDAFGTLVTRHAGPVLALLERLLPDREDARDALQEVLLDAWQGLGKLRERDRVRPWLVRIARRRAADALRGARWREEPIGVGAVEGLASRYGRGRPDPVAAEAVEAVDDLPDAERQAARMYYLARLSVAEIARATNSPAGTVKRHLHDARTHLRAMLHEREPLEEGLPCPTPE
jgi:RNA polymerase sigma-70 factor (ECF subfamily)